MTTRRYGAIKAGARTNLALLGLLAVAFLTGWLAFAFGTGPARAVARRPRDRWRRDPVPAAVEVDDRAPRHVPPSRPGRWASLGLGVLVLVSIAAGLGHSTGLVLSWGPLSSMEVHVGAAIAAVPLAVWHILARQIKVRPADVSRRAFMKGSAVVAAAAVTYAASEIVVRAAVLPGAARRFTGSYEAGSFQPAAMPVSSWMFDAIPVHDSEQWTLRTPGRTWTLGELDAFDDHVTATLDCTGGFYSTQEWSGVRLDRLVRVGQRASVRVVSSTGYDRRFPAEEADSLLLATRFGGTRLDAGHGFPARLVAPNRRGFWWVKWVVAVEVEDLPYWWQSPFPLQ